ncbi:hypothetical protein WICMUC_004597 [Wickerhamomyces mucosus]|uniref:Uncharacterized protein n=1 Tax=Wickerhamomyces mucosus TaxID=1378264 RepID=A0A9P8TAL6_9ASCO|nr:hypothetical protein WICMUC_004597 [Wickerhamomyces mucosus]
MISPEVNKLVNWLKLEKLKLSPMLKKLYNLNGESLEMFGILENNWKFALKTDVPPMESLPSFRPTEFKLKPFNDSLPPRKNLSRICNLLFEKSIM